MGKFRGINIPIVTAADTFGPAPAPAPVPVPVPVPVPETLPSPAPEPALVPDSALTPIIGAGFTPEAPETLVADYQQKVEDQDLAVVVDEEIPKPQATVDNSFPETNKKKSRRNK